MSEIHSDESVIVDVLVWGAWHFRRDNAVMVALQLILVLLKTLLLTNAGEIMTRANIIVIIILSQSCSRRYL